MTTANLGNRALFLETARIVASDSSFDSLVTVVGPAVGQGGVDYARQILNARESAPNLFVSWTAPDGPGQALLREAGIPVAPSPQRLARTMAAMRRFNLSERTQDVVAPAGREARIAQAKIILDATSGPHLAEHAAKALCRIWDLPTTREILAQTGEEAAAAATHLGFPVALKLQSASISHKTEIGGVLLDLVDSDAVRAAAAQLFQAARRHAPEAVIDGLLVQEMVKGVGEVIVGVVTDAAFGPAVMAGPGGTLAEIIDDVSFRVAPFDGKTAAALRSETRLARLEAGARGGAAWDSEALDTLLARVSVMASELAGLAAEIDLNPVIVRPVGEGVVIVDALVSKAT
jgi:acyl-CoA synthetase (NDP forming)